MRKTRIKVKANITAYADAYKATRLIVDNWRDKTTNIANSDGKAEIDPVNIELAKFGIHTKMSIVDSIYKTCCKWAIDNFMKCSNNNLITLLIMNIEAESATHIEKSLIICYYQVDILDYPDIGNINHVNEDVVSS